MERFTLQDARQLVENALSAINVNPSSAQSVARALVEAHAEGQGGHGFSRLTAYMQQAQSGKINPAAVPTARARATCIVDIDAAHGFAYPAIDLAVAETERLAKAHGMAAACISRSHHCGALSTHIAGLAERGMMAMMFANAPKALAAWGGKDAVFGTNPIAFACPNPVGNPVIIDLALSKVARGKIMLAAQRGEAIDEGLALDTDGNPTTDAKSALDGTLIPIGDTKGAALALMVEILCSAFAGGGLSKDATSFFDADGEPPNVGQLLLVFNTQTEGASYTESMSKLITEIYTDAGLRLPGQRRVQKIAAAELHGIDIDPRQLEYARTILSQV